MSHLHFCECTGREWECYGTAVRPLTNGTDPPVCICLRHQVPLEDGDHSDCPVELLTCPEHRREHQKMSILSSDDLPSDEGAAHRSMVDDGDGKPIVGFCLWCNKNFDSIDEVETHNLNESAACAVFQKFKNKQFMSLDTHDSRVDVAPLSTGPSEE